MPERARGPVMVTLNLSTSEARDFLRRLEQDDDFRRRLKSNPQKTLADANIIVSKEAIPDKVELPPPEDVRRAFGRGGGEVRFPFIDCFMWGVAYCVASLVPARRRKEGYGRRQAAARRRSR